MQDGCWPFHLFGANFVTESDARKFVFEQWEPEPPESTSEAEYISWEERNPIWRLAEELGFYMDSDFVELIGTPEDVIAQIAAPLRECFSAPRQQNLPILFWWGRMPSGVTVVRLLPM